MALISGYYFASFRLDFWLLSGPAVPVFGDLFNYTLAPVLGLLMLPSILRRLFAPRSIPANFKRDFPFSLALRPKQLRAAAEESAYLIPATARLQPEYQNITCPVRLIHGDTDQVIEKEQTVRLHKVLSDSVMQLVPEAGHMVHYVDANMVSRVVSHLRYSI
jgi:pimeloyl-ACP methyl ester carboxylesterase